MEHAEEKVSRKGLNVKTDFEKIKTHDTTVIPGIGNNKIKPPTNDGQTSFETYRLQFEVVGKTSNWSDKEKVMALVVALRAASAGTAFR